MVEFLMIITKFTISLMLMGMPVFGWYVVFHLKVFQLVILYLETTTQNVHFH